MKKEYRIQLVTEMLGTVAKDPEVYKTYIESKKVESKTPAVVAEDESATIPIAEGLELKGWTGFHKDEGGLFIYEYMIKGFLKHAGNVLKESLKIKNLRFWFVSPRRISLGKQEPDGVLERPLRVMTMMGPRVTLARSDYVNAGTEILFTVNMLAHPDLNEKALDTIMAHGELMGLGQFRNGGYGRFTVMNSSVV
jgi:hypothetical protein